MPLKSVFANLRGATAAAAHLPLEDQCNGVDESAGAEGWARMLALLDLGRTSFGGLRALAGEADTSFTARPYRRE